MAPATTELIATPLGAIECLRIAGDADPARGKFVLPVGWSWGCS